MSQTRKYRGGSLFSLGSKPSLGSNLKAKRNYNLSRSKSRVANILATPGQFKYTNKEAIQAKYEKALQQLQQIEKPKETVTALQSMSASLDAAIHSQAARETGAVVITIPIGLAQAALKAIRIFISILVVVFIDLPLGVLSGSYAVNLAAAVAPNSRFNTTAKAYKQARQLTGANTITTVKNY